MGIGGLPRFEDTKDQMQELTHDGDHNTHLAVPTPLKPLHQRLHQGIGILGGHSRQVERGTDGSTTHFGDTGATSDRGTSAMLTGIETGEGD